MMSGWLLLTVVCATPPVFAQDDTREDDTHEEDRGNSEDRGNRDEPGPPDDLEPGPPDDLQPRGQSDGPRGLWPHLDWPWQLADSTVQLMDTDGNPKGHVWSRIFNFGASATALGGGSEGFGFADIGLEMWVFDPNTAIPGPYEFDLLVGPPPKPGSWPPDLGTYVADGYEYVCVEVFYVGVSIGNANGVIQPLNNPSFTTYALSFDGGPDEAWLLRGIGSDGSVGEVYAFTPDYQPPDEGQTLSFRLSSSQFQSVNDYMGLVGSQSAYLGTASYGEPELLALDTTCTASW